MPDAHSFTRSLTNYSSKSLPSWMAFVGIVVFSTLAAVRALADAPPSLSNQTAPLVFAKDDPESLSDLLEMEKQFRKVSKQVIPTTVNLQVGNAQGSGVIVSKEGEILTAAHVIGRTGREVRIILASVPADLRIRFPCPMKPEVSLGRPRPSG